MVSKRIYLALAVLGAVGILAVAGLRAQSRSNDENENEKEVLQGSFVVTIHVNQGGLTLKVLDTFSLGGGVIATSFNPSGALQTEQGAWRRTGDREFALTLKGISPASFVRVKTREKLTVDESGDSFNGVFQSQFFDASGNVVFTATGTVQGTRIVVEPLD